MGTHTQTANSRANIRVGLLMAYPMGAEALTSALGAEDDIDIVHAAWELAEFLPVLSSGRLDVVILDLQADAGAAFEVLNHHAVRRGHTRAVILSASRLPGQMASLRALAAAGFVPKSAHVAEVLLATRTVAAGGSYFRSDDQYTGPHHPPPSHRELQLLAALRSGASNADIAHTLGISVRTVESHLRRLFARYKTSSRAELLMLALRHNWIRLDPAPDT